MANKKRKRLRIKRIKLMPTHKRRKRPNMQKKRILKDETQIMSQGTAPFVRALVRLQNLSTTDTYGPAGDQCITVRSEDFKKVRVDFDDNARAKYYRPYKIAWLAEHGAWPGGTKQCSHLCGAKECINVDHLVAETTQRNNSRKICHNKLIKWAEERQLSSDLKYTFDTFGEGKCGHPKECFIMIRFWMNEH